MIEREDAESRYLSYLLRAWEDASGGAVVWIYEMESIQTGEKLTFANLQALYDFLKEREFTQ
ncbi:MAG: hypothetical protein R3272_07655 [Candidatus Promineifilaceae bacterium]|nr:hypothetical protein [Candidatus Promineifilaceae bacterium]